MKTEAEIRTQLERWQGIKTEGGIDMGVASTVLISQIKGRISALKWVLEEEEEEE